MKFFGFDSADSSGEYSGRPSKKHFNRIRNLIMLLTKFELNLSTKQIVGLRWQDLNLLTGRILLRRETGEAGKEYNLDEDILWILQRWRKYQARATYYKALEYVFTDYEGQPVSALFVYALQALWFLNTFIPLNLVPDAPRDSGF